MPNCDPRRLARFLSEGLDVDEKLDFLYHLDRCPECWEALYDLKRAQHSHYYQKKGRKMVLSKKELAQVDKEKKVSEVA